MSTLALATTPVRQAKKKSHFRPDIQGLRAIAVLVVLLYHAGVTTFSGGYVGVDIFFVISGFLITGHLIRVGSKTGRIDLVDFYARRIRRILPAATVVLLFTAITTVVILPATRWESIGLEIFASAFYLVNWVFAANTDYLNADSAASPIQHFWTLAVEEQFYIVWPALILVLLYFARPRSTRGKGRSQHRTRPRLVHRYIALGALALTGISLAWSIYYSVAAPAPAYFTTTTRLWELGIGAVVAAFATQFEKIPARTGFLLGFVGLAAIVAAGLFYDSTTVFPGFAALLPTLGTAAVIIAGMNGRAEQGVGAILRGPAMRWVGDLSYSLYLWHWPLLVLGAHLLGGELDVWQGLAIVALSFVPAWLSYHYVENPIRNWTVVKKDAPNTLKMGAVLMMVSVLAGTVLIVMVERASSATTTFSRTYASALKDGDENSALAQPYGAEALRIDPAVGAVVDHVPSFQPSAMAAHRDNPANYSLGCHQEANETDFEACVFGDEDADFTVALVGDSHAAQWLPALEPLATVNGWRLETYTKSSCPLIGTAITQDGKSFYSECYNWNQNALDHLTGPNAPDHVLLSSALHGVPDSADPGVPTGNVSDGYALAWNELQEAGIPLTVLADTPRPRINVPECVSQNEDQLSECAVSRDEAMRNGAVQQRTAAQQLEVPMVDLTEFICPGEHCAPVIGEVLVYRDTNHLTATYSATLTGVLEEELRKQGNLPFSAVSYTADASS